MTICNNCGVELDPDMKTCPLCDNPVSQETSIGPVKVEDTKSQTRLEGNKMNRPQRKVAWELASIIVILTIVVTGLLDLIISKEMSWSEYPMAISLLIYCYISSFTFLDKGIEIQLLFALISSSVLIFVVDLLAGGKPWALFLGIPLVFFINCILLLFLQAVRYSKQKGINLIAYFFMAAALLCISIEGTADLYLYSNINLIWSLIVNACVIPVASVFLFMHFRLKKGQDLGKIFHI